MFDVHKAPVKPKCTTCYTCSRYLPQRDVWVKTNPHKLHKLMCSSTQNNTSSSRCIECTLQWIWFNTITKSYEAAQKIENWTNQRLWVSNCEERSLPLFSSLASHFATPRAKLGSWILARSGPTSSKVVECTDNSFPLSLEVSKDFATILLIADAKKLSVDNCRNKNTKLWPEMVHMYHDSLYELLKSDKRCTMFPWTDLKTGG